jgi:hypothetical protein
LAWRTGFWVCNPRLILPSSSFAARFESPQGSLISLRLKLFNNPSEEYTDATDRLGNTNGGRFTTFGGGLPIVNAKGELVGGIGASTGTPAQDQQVVQAGVDALNKIFKEGEALKAKL